MSLFLLTRCKANLQTKLLDFEKDNYNTPHVDRTEEHLVLLYYVNDSDGDTFLFDEHNEIITRVSPKKGRMLFFNGNISHAGSHPKHSEKRIVINYNLQYGDY